MRQERTESKLNILKFSNQNKGMDIASSRNILWPCHAFSVSFPVRKNNGINIFEETLLKLVKLGYSDTQKLKEITCLDTQLISFITNRLKRLDLVDDQFQITTMGKQKLGYSVEGESHREQDFVVASLFLDLTHGNLLPFVGSADISYESIIEKKGGLIKIESGSTGRGKPELCFAIWPDKYSYWNRIPSVDDVLVVLKKYKRRAQKHSRLSGDEGTTFGDYIPNPGAITINPQPERVYLYSQAIVQQGNNNLLVTDGTGMGFSRDYVRYLELNHSNIVVQIKNQAIEQSIEKKGEQTSNPNLTWIYPEVTGRFMATKNKFLKYVEKPETESDEKINLEILQETVVNMYAALEWTFKFVLQEHPVKEWEEYYASEDYRQNKRILVKFAEKIGLVVDRNNQFILEVKPGAIRHLSKGSVTMQALLTLLITGTATNDAHHPFQDLISENHDLLSFIVSLKRKRDAIQHGDISNTKLGFKEVEKIRIQTAKYITMLLPDAESEIQLQLSVVIEQSARNQDRTKAHIDVQKEIEPILWVTLSNQLKELLIRSQLMINDNLQSEVAAIMINYYSFLQQFINDILNQLKGRYSGETGIKNRALDRLVNRRLVSSRQEIPRELKTVRPDRVDNAITSTGATLGAVTLGLIHLSDNEELSNMKELDPEWVLTISKVLQQRGHGNSRLTNLSRGAMLELKKKTYKTAESLCEVYLYE